MRYERKYRIENAGFRQVEMVIRHNTASFKTAYPDRRINSIYFDDVAFSSLQDTGNLVSLIIETRRQL